MWFDPSTGEIILAEGSIHIRDLLDVNCCVNFSLDNGLYCTKSAHSHLLLHRLKNSIIGCVLIFLRLCGLKTLRNSSQ